MKTTTRFLLAASTALAMALTFSACSDDKDDPKYGTCDEAATFGYTCFAQAFADIELQAAYTACMVAAGGDEDAEDACDEVFETATEKCVFESGVCGDASFATCMKHFDKECDWEDED
jgi:hypothetical protein